MCSVILPPRSAPAAGITACGAGSTTVPPAPSPASAAHECCIHPLHLRGHPVLGVARCPRAHRRRLQAFPSPHPKAMRSAILLSAFLVGLSNGIDQSVFDAGFLAWGLIRLFF